MILDKPPLPNEVVDAVLSGSRAAPRLVRRFTDEVGDPASQLSGVASGGFVWFPELGRYEDIYDLSVLEGRTSARRLDELEADEPPIPAERLIFTRRKLRDYFAEPVEGAGYAIFAVVGSKGRKAYWAEVREG